ncbi:hypothetical protein D9M72_403690 [compost metagenome]
MEQGGFLHPHQLGYAFERRTLEAFCCKNIRGRLDYLFAAFRSLGVLAAWLRR